jgi:hypothetical protein
MLLPKFIGLFAVCLLATQLAECAGYEAEVSQGNAGVSQTNSANSLVPALTAAVKDEETIGDRPIHHAYLTFGTNQFSFIVPDGYRVDCSNPEVLAVINQNYDCFITMRVIDRLPAGAQEVHPDTCRELLLARYPDASITEEYSRSVANHVGPAFDFQWLNPGKSLQSGRVIYVPMAGRIVEFSLVVEAGKFSGCQQFFHAILLTFRTNEKGKLEVAHFAESV